MKKKVLLTSITTIILCVSIITGATFALFTDRQDLDVSVTAGNVELTAYYDTDSMKTWSVIEGIKYPVRDDQKFDNGGTATFHQNTDPSDGTSVYTSVIIDRMTPGDVAQFMIDVTNKSNVGVQYRVRMISRPLDGAVDLTPALITTANIDGVDHKLDRKGDEVASNWAYIDQNADINDILITIEFPVTDYTICPPRESYDSVTAYKDPITGEMIYNADNYYQNAKAEIIFVVEAVQSNARVYDYLVSDYDSLDAAFNPAGGIINADNRTVVFGGTGSLYLQNETKIIDTVIDARSHEGYAAIYAPVYGDDTPALILDYGAKIYAPTNGYGSAILCNFRTTPITMNSGSKIIATGRGNSAIQFNEGEHTLILNDVELIEARNGAYGISLVGVTLNIYVKDADAKAHYERLITDLEPTMPSTVNWYVDGVLAN